MPMLKHTPEKLQCGDRVYLYLGDKIVSGFVQAISRHPSGDTCTCTLEGDYQAREASYFPDEVLFRDYDELAKAVASERQAIIKEYSEQLKDINSLVEFLWNNRSMDNEAEVAVRNRVKELLGISLV